MDYDKKNFFKYVWHDQIHPKNWLNNSNFYESVMMFIVLYAVIFTDMSLRQKAILFVLFLIGISIIKFYTLYKSGSHRDWNRKNYGIPSKSWVKKQKEKRKIEQNNIQKEREREKIPPKEVEVLGKEKSDTPIINDA